MLLADDTVVVAESERKLCQLVTEFERVCERRKLRVNVGKSKVMRCTRNEDSVSLNHMLNGKVLEEVDQFKYLLSVIAANGGVEEDVHHIVCSCSSNIICIVGLIMFIVSTVILFLCFKVIKFG